MGTVTGWKTIVIVLDLAKAQYSPKRYWRGPKSEAGRKEGRKEMWVLFAQSAMIIYIGAIREAGPADRDTRALLNTTLKLQALVYDIPQVPESDARSVHHAVTIRAFLR